MAATGSKEPSFAVTTWRCLRLAMVGLVVGLGLSLAYERSLVDCFQTSISAYYYTPVHGYFIGALVAIGVCLFSLEGNTEVEDVLLNLAGMCAPIVALVPISDPGSCHAILGTRERDLDIANNVRALLAVELLALVLVAFLARRGRPSRAHVIGYAAGASLWLVTTLVFYAARDVFVSWAHFSAAGLMFALIAAVVWINALGYRERTNAASARNRYAAIAGAMAGSLVLIPIGLLRDWPYWVIVLEGVLIALFAVFWLLQTRELWDEGLRRQG